MQILIAKDGQKLGPYSEAQVKEMVEGGEIALTDLAWHDGMTDWIPVACVIATAEPGPETPPAIPPPFVRRAIDPNLAGRGARLGALLLDLVAGAISVLPGLVLIWADAEDETMVTLGTGLCLVGLIALIATQLVLLTKRGQTIGKRIVGLRIVKYADDSSPGFLHAVVYRAILPAIIGNIPLLGPLFAIVDACFIFGEERRCLHDVFASTKVVNA